MTKKQNKKKNKRNQNQSTPVNGYSTSPPNSRPANSGTENSDIERDSDEKPSIELHELLNKAGFNAQGANRQLRATDSLQDAARQLASDERQLIGDFAELWTLDKLTDRDGKQVAKNKIKWLIVRNSDTNDKVHLEGDCQCQGKRGKRLAVQDGRVAVTESFERLPTLSIPGSGTRPAQEIRYAYECCSLHRADRVQLLLPANSDTNARVVLEMGADSEQPSKLKVSFRLQEKQIMRRLSTIQGQLYVLIKIVFKKLLPKSRNLRCLGAYHAKTLLFFMLERHRTTPGIWKKEKLVSLLMESFDLMVDFMDKNPTAIMPNYFMPELSLRLKTKDLEVDFSGLKLKIVRMLRSLQDDITPLLEFAKSHVSSRQSEKVFQLFTVLPLVKLNVSEEFTDDALLYLYVQDLFNWIPKLREVDLAEFLGRISKLRWLPRSSSVSACLVVMAHLKFGDFERAKEKLQQVMWRQVEPCRFCFPGGVEPDFSFLPEFTRTLIKTMDYGTDKMLQVNFRALLMSLQAELLLKDQMFPNEWSKAIEDDPDVDDLKALAHYSRNPERLRKCSKLMEERLNKGILDACVADACFNGLVVVMALSAVLAVLSRVALLVSDAPVLEGVTDILIFVVAAFACCQLYLHMKFSAWLLLTLPSREWRNQWFTTVEFSVILPLLSVALSFVANKRFFVTIFILVRQRLLPDLMHLHQWAEKTLLELVLTLR